MRGAPIMLIPSLLACGPSEVEPPDPELPDDTDPPAAEPPPAPELPDDTGFGAPENPSPPHWLHARHEGRWNLTGSPWSALQGTITVTEILDEPADTAAPPACHAEWDMVGSAAAEPGGCAECDALFDVTFVLTTGDPAPCRLPDLPADGEVRRMGWSSDHAAILLDYRDTGVFLPWYPATRSDDVVQFEWQMDLGIHLEEDE